MKTLFKSVKGKVLVGVLAIGVVGAGAASASGFGFIDQLQNILNTTTDNVASYSAGAVTAKDDSNKDYGQKITEEVNAATNLIKRELNGHASAEIGRGNTELDNHFNNLSSDLATVKTNTITTGKAKITTKVDQKVTSEKNRVEDAAVTAINANLNAEVTFTGMDTVTK